MLTDWFAISFSSNGKQRLLLIETLRKQGDALINR